MKMCVRCMLLVRCGGRKKERKEEMMETGLENVRRLLMWSEWVSKLR